MTNDAGAARHEKGDRAIPLGHSSFVMRRKARVIRH
jgi:hypothetical protein